MEVDRQSLAVGRFADVWFHRGIEARLWAGRLGAQVQRYT